MEKNLKKIALLFTLVVTAVSIKALDYSQEDESPSYAGTDDSDMTAYGEGDYQQDDSSPMPADEELQNNDARYAGAFNDAADYTDDQTNYVDTSEEPQPGEVADYSGDYTQDAQRPLSGEDSDESMTDEDNVQIPNEYDPSVSDENFEGEYFTEADDAGVEDYEQPLE